MYNKLVPLAVVGVIILVGIFLAYNAGRDRAGQTITTLTACTEGKFYLSTTGELQRCYNGARGSCVGGVCSITKKVIIKTRATSLGTGTVRPVTTVGGRIGVSGAAPVSPTQVADQPFDAISVSAKLFVSVGATDTEGTPPSDPGLQDLVTRLSFKGWEDMTPLNPLPLTREITVTSDATYTALWEKKHAVKTVVEDVQGCADTPAGTITIFPMPDINGFYAEGATLNVTASPAEGYHLQQWKIKSPGMTAGGPAAQDVRQPDSQTGPQTITLQGTKPYEITAVFSRDLACTVIQAESFATKNDALNTGQEIELRCSGTVAAWIQSGTMFTYNNINIPSSGVYDIKYSTATIGGASVIAVAIDDVVTVLRSPYQFRTLTGKPYYVLGYPAGTDWGVCTGSDSTDNAKYGVSFSSLSPTGSTDWPDGIVLTPGIHTLSLVSLGSLNIDWFKLVQRTAGCPEKWVCSAWSTCPSGTQTRTCTDQNKCGTTPPPEMLSQVCEVPPQATVTVTRLTDLFYGNIMDYNCPTLVLYGTRCLTDRWPVPRGTSPTNYEVISTILPSSTASWRNNQLNIEGSFTSRIRSLDGLSPNCDPVTEGVVCKRRFEIYPEEAAGCIAPADCAVPYADVNFVHK